MPTLFYSLVNNPDEWSNNDANDTNINSYLLLSAYSALRQGAHFFFFTHSIWFIPTKSKEEKTFKIPVSKTIELDGSVGIQTQEYTDPK